MNKNLSFWQRPSFWFKVGSIPTPLVSCCIFTHIYIPRQVAGISGAAAVGLGAFGAHGLRARVTDPYLLEIWNRAASYHQVHSLAVCAAAYCANNEGKPAFVAATLFTVGIALFSGSLYTLVSCLCFCSH